VVPPVGAAFASGGLRIEGAERVGNPPRLAVTLRPHGPLGLAPALSRVEVLTRALRVEVFGRRPAKRHKGLQDRVEVLRAPRQGRAARHLRKAKDLAQVCMRVEPAGLGLQAQRAALVRDKEKPTQSLVLIATGRSLVGTG
jgi:hypothetical protein